MSASKKNTKFQLVTAFEKKKQLERKKSTLLAKSVSTRDIQRIADLLRSSFFSYLHFLENLDSG